MAQKKTLVDSNSYFRLAKSIHPLLFQEFGEEKYCLYVLKELDEEYGKSPRLKSKFPWVNDEEFSDNRKHYLTIGRAQKREIQDAFDYIWDYVQTENKGPSRIDTLYLAHAYVLGIILVTDDQDMIEVAKTYGIQVRSTMEVMRLMYDCGHITLAKVKEIVAYWRYVEDRPANLEKDYERLFREEERRLAESDKKRASSTSDEA